MSFEGNWYCDEFKSNVVISKISDIPDTYNFHYTNNDNGIENEQVAIYIVDKFNALLPYSKQFGRCDIIRHDVNSMSIGSNYFVRDNQAFIDDKLNDENNN